MSSSEAAVDAIYAGGTVITMDPSRPRAKTVVVRDGLIAAVGDDSLQGHCCGPDTRLVDLRGRTLLPGFHDAHCHLLASAARLLAVDCSPDKTRSILDIQTLIRRGVRDRASQDWVRAAGYNEFYLRERRHPDRKDLDLAAPNYPVRLLHRSGHAMVLSSRALSAVGITAATPDPPGGIIERDSDGEPTGLLLGAVDHWDALIPRLPENEMRAGLRTLLRSMTAAGIVAVQDATDSNGYDRWRFLCELDGAGDMPLHVSMMLGAEKMGEFTDCGCATHLVSGNISLGAVKLIVDETAGDVYPALPDLEQTLFTAHLAGFQTAQHAVEGRALEVAIKALGRVLERVPSPNHRHRIEHCSLCPGDLRRRIRELGAIVVTQPSFIFYSGERYLSTVTAARQSDLYPLGSLMREGVVLGAGSDSPVSGFEPLLGIYAAVTRRAANGSLIAPEETISPDSALAMYTSNAACSSYADSFSGSIEVGKKADFVVLNADPTRCEAEMIREIRVEATILEGKVAYEA